MLQAVQAALDQGMAALSQAEVGSALQVFHNLQELRQVSSNFNCDTLRSACSVIACCRRLRVKLGHVISTRA